MKPRLVLPVVAVALFLSIVPPLHAEEITVLRVIVVKTENMDTYLQELEKGQAHMKRLGTSGNLRVWKPKFVGRVEGNVVVSIEYPSMAVYAKDDEKMAADPAVRSWLQNLAKIRTIVSDSLYTGSKP